MLPEAKAEVGRPPARTSDKQTRPHRRLGAGRRRAASCSRGSRPSEQVTFTAALGRHTDLEGENEREAS